MKCKKMVGVILTGILSLLPMMSYATAVNATEPETKTVTIMGDLSNPSSYQEELNRLLADESVEGVYVLDRTLMESSTELKNEFIFEPETEVSPYATTSYYYRIKDVKAAGEVKGSSTIAKAAGTPGTTLTITATKSISNSYSINAALQTCVSASTVSTAVGFQVTKEESIAISGSKYVASSVNGKSVESMTLIAKPLYDKTTFTIERHKSVGGVNYGWSKYGSGSALKAIGVYFTQEYKYK